MDWTRARPLLAKLIDLPESERLATLEHECQGEPELKRRIEVAWPMRCSQRLRGGKDALRCILPRGEAMQIWWLEACTHCKSATPPPCNVTFPNPAYR